MNVFLFLDQEKKMWLLFVCPQEFLTSSALQICIPTLQSSRCVPSSSPYTLTALWFWVWSTVQLCGDWRATAWTDRERQRQELCIPLLTVPLMSSDTRQKLPELHGFLRRQLLLSDAVLKIQPGSDCCCSVQRRCCRAVFSHHCPRWVTLLVQMLPPQRLKAPDISCTAPGHWGRTHMKEHERTHEHTHPVLETCLYIHGKKIISGHAMFKYVFRWGSGHVWR